MSIDVNTKLESMWGDIEQVRNVVHDPEVSDRFVDRGSRFIEAQARAAQVTIAAQSRSS